MTEEIRQYQVNGKYRIQFERAANTRTDGFKIEVNDDSLQEAQKQAEELYIWAINRLAILSPPATIKKE